MEELQTAAGFHRIYKNQLQNLANRPSPSANQLVLVLANAVMFGDHELVELVRRRTTELGLADPKADGDEHVLSYILGVHDPFQLVHHRVTPAGWRITFNEMRSLRPSRNATKPMDHNHEPFDATKFNFSLVPDEAFWHGRHLHRPISLFYNKYPIERYHSLIVPNPDDNREQFLQPEDHAFAWDLHAVLSEHQPRLLIGYNAFGAAASVNQLHFQLMPDAPALNLLQREALDHYPIPVAHFDSSDAAWRHIHRLQSENRAFNAVYAPGRMYVIERAYSGQYQLPAWTTGFAWWELSGGILTIDEAAFRTLTDDQIQAVFTDIQPR